MLKREEKNYSLFRFCGQRKMFTHFFYLKKTKFESFFFEQDFSTTTKTRKKIKNIKDKKD
jgi:hypothetical protein